MDFSQVDVPFDEWAQDNGLQVFKHYKDYNVRSITIVKSTQSKWQMWLEPNPDMNQCIIKYWDYGSKRYEVLVSVEELKEILQKIYDVIISNKGDKSVNT